MATYEKWANGDVFVSRVYDRSDCDHCGRGDWEYSDGCGGFYSVTEALEPAFSSLIPDDSAAALAVLPSYWKDGK